MRCALGKWSSRATSWWLASWILTALVFAPLCLGLETPEIVKRASPAVVLIEVYDSQMRPTGKGSGFFVSGDGLIVTNKHVIANAYRIRARRIDGATFGIEQVVFTPKDVDLAVLKSNAKDCAYLEIAGDPRPAIGSKIVVVVNPLGWEGTVAEGIISGRRKRQGGGYVLQISAPISPGSSGSPVLSSDAKVVGVATSIWRESGAQAINFAIAGEDVASAVAACATSDPPHVLRAEEPSDAYFLSEMTAMKEEILQRAFESALRRGNALAAKYPKSAGLAYNLGLVYNELGSYEQAVATYKKSISLDRSKAYTWTNLANTYFRQSRFEDASNAARESIRILPAGELAWNTLGNAQFKLEQYVEGIKSFKRALEIKPTYLSARVSLALCYLALEDYVHCEDEYLNVFSVDPTNQAAREGLALLAKLKSESAVPPKENAPKSLDESIHAKTLEAHAIVQGRVLGPKKRAVALYLEAAKAGDPDAMVNLGHLMKSGTLVKKDLKGAHAWYEAAAKRGSPEAAEALRNFKP